MPKKEEELMPLGALIIGIVTTVIVLTLLWYWVFVGAAPTFTACHVSGGDYSVLHHGCYDTNGKEIRMKK
jgi:hypothetical protein